MVFFIFFSLILLILLLFVIGFITPPLRDWGDEIRSQCRKDRIVITRIFQNISNRVKAIKNALGRFRKI